MLFHVSAHSFVEVVFFDVISFSARLLTLLIVYLLMLQFYRDAVVLWLTRLGLGLGHRLDRVEISQI